MITDLSLHQLNSKTNDLVLLLRATCCNGQLYLCKIEKNRFSENLSERRS